MTVEPGTTGPGFSRLGFEDISPPLRNRLCCKAKCFLVSFTSSGIYESPLKRVLVLSHGASFLNNNARQRIRIPRLGTRTNRCLWQIFLPPPVPSNHRQKVSFGEARTIALQARALGVGPVSARPTRNLSRRVRELLGMTKLLSGFETCGEFPIRMP